MQPTDEVSLPTVLAEMQDYVNDGDKEGGHIAGDALLVTLIHWLLTVSTLSDEDKAIVQAITEAYENGHW